MFQQLKRIKIVLSFSILTVGVYVIKKMSLLALLLRKNQISLVLLKHGFKVKKVIILASTILVDIHYSTQIDQLKKEVE